MSESVSIQFKKGNEISVALFSQDDGPELVEEAQRYAKRLMAACGNSACSPLERFQPNTVMVDFIRYLMKEQNIVLVESNYYLGQDETCGYNSDHGNHIIDFDAIVLPQEWFSTTRIFALSEAGRILKLELENTFPETKFSVETRRTCAKEEFIDIGYKNGPQEYDVKKVAERFEIFLVDNTEGCFWVWYRRVRVNGKSLRRITSG